MNTTRIAHEHEPLKKVLMHRPTREITSVTADTVEYFNFAGVPNPAVFLAEFDALRAAFEGMGTEVILVGDVLKNDADALEYISRRANMVYTRDLAVVTPGGAVLCGMAIDGRKGDPDILGKVFARLGVPVVARLEPDGVLEGGGITFFRGDTAVVGKCWRSNAAGLSKFEDAIKQGGIRRLVTVPVPPDQFHIDGQLVFIDSDLAIIDAPVLDYAPATIKDLQTGETRQQYMTDFLAKENVETIGVEPGDGWAAVNFVMTAPRQIVGYDWATRVMSEVERRGGKAVGVSGVELRKGNGGPHCMTCPLER